MSQKKPSLNIYLEIGQKKTFAGAVDWPGWSRSGRDEAAAIQALWDYGPRYGRVLQEASIDFSIPADSDSFNVVERLAGNATTDFGAPDVAPAADARSVDVAELQRLQALLQAYWQAFDAARETAVGQELRRGPRGGGRDLEKIIQHVLGSDAGYLRQLGWKFKQDESGNTDGELERLHQAILEGLAAAARGELAARGPRGGLRWTPRYFVRRSAWHVLDHTWEIEDRLSSD